MKSIHSLVPILGSILAVLSTVLATPHNHGQSSAQHATIAADWQAASGDLSQLRRRQDRPELRIMPLGASTVFGVGSDDGNGFRKLLRDQARYEGYAVNMVGTKNGGNMTDNDCEATSGNIITEIHEESRSSYKFNPNVVVMNAGTNDCIRAIDNENQHNRLRAVIEDLWTNISPDVVVIVSTLLPLEGNANDIRNSVNDGYRQMVEDLAAEGRSIYIADMDYIGADELPDNIHPNDGGYRKMAAVFWAGIEAAERDQRIKEPLPMEQEDEGDNCRKNPGEGVWAGGLTQRGSGEDNGIYRHSSEDMGTILTITSDWDRDQWFFARLFRQDRDDILGWFQRDDGAVRYGVWRNDGDGSFTKIDDLNVQNNCTQRGVVFIDVNADGLDDFVCIATNGDAFASINLGTGSGNSPPSFRNIGIWKAAESSYPQAQVRLGDIDGDGRADYCALDPNGDMHCWRNGGVDDEPAYWQALGRRFTGEDMGDLSGVRLEDVNGDGRDDWLWVSDSGATTTFTNSRSCARGREGDGLNVAWRQGFHGDANSGPTHTGGFGDDVRDRVHFARIYGEPQDFGLLGRQDYVLMEHREEEGRHHFDVRVFKNRGSGSTKLVADGNKYCDMTGDGRDDYVWVLSKGRMTIYPNAGNDFISGSQSYWGSSVQIFDPNQHVDRDLDRRDLHLADWDGDGKCDIIWVDPNNENRVSLFRNEYTPDGGWAWEYDADPAPALHCPEKRGLGIHDLPVRFADVSGSGRADYLCVEKDGRTWGWTQDNDGAWTAIDQFKSAKGHDRANLGWADVNGDGLADAIWTDKFNGDGLVYYNLGRRDTGGSRYEWEQQAGGGPFPAFSGQVAGTCTYYPDLDGNGRADLHAVKGTFTNEAETWYNVCGDDREGDDGDVSDPELPSVELPPSPGTGESHHRASLFLMFCMLIISM